MREIYIGNGTTEYQLHSTTQMIPSYVKRGIEGLDNPSMRIDAYDNPGTHGETVAQVLSGGSLITLSGELRGLWSGGDAEIISAYEAERLALAAATTHTYNALGHVQPLILRFTTLSGRQLQVSGFKDRYKAPVDRNTRNEWFLQLRNPSGVVESQSTQTTTITLPKDGGVVYDLVYDIVYGDSSGGLATATNTGTAAAKPVITFHGPIQNPRLTNTLTNEFIALNHTLAAGETLVIDVDADTIIQGTATNRMGKRSTGSVMWSVHPGANPLKLTATTYDTGYAEVTFRDTWGAV